MLKSCLNKWSFSLFIILFFFISKGYSSILLGTTPFITTWKTDNPGFSNNDQIIIPTSGAGYNYTVDWGDGTPSTIETGDATHTYTTPGVYTVQITGDFPNIFFNGAGDNDKILTIEQWGDNQWNSMASAFSGCSNLQGNFTDSPDLSNVTSLAGMFSGATSFNHNISNWDVSNVTNMSSMFNNATAFNQNIGNWDLSNTVNTGSMFADASSFNQDISNWAVSNVISTSSMFRRAIAFNQNIGNWNVGNVTNMFGMFSEATAFNQAIGGWDVSSVSIMQDMFRGATVFNQDIGAWDVGNVINMRYLFSESAFNQDISKWDVSKVTDMRSMFQNNVNFNQNIGGWVVDNLTSANNMFSGAKLSPLNYDALLIGWDAQNLNPNISFHGGFSKYCAGVSARANMLSSDGWSILDEGLADPSVNDLSDQNVFRNITLPVITGVDLIGNEAYYTGSNGTGTAFYAGDVISFFDFPSYPVTLYIYGGNSVSCSSQEDFQLTITNTIIPFITTWKTDNPGVSANNQISIPIFSGGNNYTIDWGDGTPITIETNQATHTYATPGVYTVIITGDSQNIAFSDAGDKDKILTIEQWGNTQWSTMFKAFQGCSNLQGNYADSPNFSIVTSTAFMFDKAGAFNYNVSNWDVSNIVEMQAMFANASRFNQDVSNWNIAKAEDLSFLFNGASAFNQYIGDWDVSSATNMESMFEGATLFNQDISNWNVNRATNMISMFEMATAFDQDLGSWNIINVTDMSKMFDGVRLSVANYDALLIGWNTQNLQPNVVFSGGLSQYCLGEAARITMIANDNWIITDAGLVAPIIDDIANQTASSNYTLPIITGVNLTGNQRYYTGINGTGTAYDIGDVISFNDFSSYPVTIYIYDTSSSGCSSEQDFELTILNSVPLCTYLTQPLTGAINVSIGTDFIWNPVSNATGYKLTVSTSSGGIDILNRFDVGNVSSYDLLADLPENTSIYVTVIPYNLDGDAVACSEDMFNTEMQTTVANNELPPKFFSPNNDNTNDFWIVPNALNQVSSIYIYDRYGKLIKQIGDIATGWDGTFNGNPLPVNDYWYQIIYKDGEVLKGHFSLIR